MSIPITASARADDRRAPGEAGAATVPAGSPLAPSAPPAPPASPMGRPAQALARARGRAAEPVAAGAVERALLAVPEQVGDIGEVQADVAQQLLRQRLARRVVHGL